MSPGRREPCTAEAWGMKRDTRGRSLALRGQLLRVFSHIAVVQNQPFSRQKVRPSVRVKMNQGAEEGAPWKQGNVSGVGGGLNIQEGVCIGGSLNNSDCMAGSWG